MNAAVIAEDTRRKLLEVAAEEILEHGFQATSIGDILIKTGLSKGALYHHFPSKLILGYAVFEEVYMPKCADRWQSVFDSSDPISSIIELLRTEINEISDETIRFGCPLNNLAQEMSPIDEGFRQRINGAINHWRSNLQMALEHGQKAGNVKQEINTLQVASFFVASMEGSIGLAKNAQDRALLEECFAGLISYLEGLRP